MGDSRVSAGVRAARGARLQVVDTMGERASRLSTRVRFAADGPRDVPTSTMAPRVRNSKQRERLLDGMIEVANRRGYAGANVSAVIAEAGVSRPTFYDQFADRDDCFVAAIEVVNAELAEAVAGALEDAPAAQALPAAVTAALEFAASEPHRARFLMSESMSGGHRALDARDRGIEAAAALVEQALQGASATSRVADLDPRVALGSTYRMVATRLRRGDPAVAKLTAEMGAWLAAYETRAGRRRWQTLEPGPVPQTAAHVPAVPIQQMPGVFPPGRPRVDAAEIAENHRLRILWAAARLAEEKGYLATSVAEITKLARLDGRNFYRLFSDRQEAFTAAHELGFQQVMDVTAKAYFAVEGWPRRSWEAGRALTQLLADNPLVAKVGFVEAYAVGPAAVQRIEDSHTAFLFFLQEGLAQDQAREPPSRVAMEAIIAGVFEVIYLQARDPSESQIAAMVGQIEHLWLTPFLGVAETNSFIDRQLRSKPARSRK
jgi:AcrR family transcriptional regulator